MSAPPTRRSSRSRYSSPAVAAARNQNDSSRDRDRSKDRSRDAAQSSMDRSRQFMENWIEPDRSRLASFQEHGLIRQGVLETMEPLGTRPKPAVIKKLLGAAGGNLYGGMLREGSGQDGSTTPAARKPGAKKIILKRKNGNGAIVGNNEGPKLSGTQSPTPSSTVATPQAVASPSLTPAPPPPVLPVPLQQDNSPTPTPAECGQKTRVPPLTLDSIQDHNATPELKAHPLPLPISHHNSPPRQSLPPLGNPFLPSSILSSNPFLPDPIKQSIEGPLPLHHLPTTPKSVATAASFDVDIDDYSNRESSALSASIGDMPSKRAAGRAAAARIRSASVTADLRANQPSASIMQRAASASAAAPALAPAPAPVSVPVPQVQVNVQPLPRIWPDYNEAELARISQPQQKEVVTKAIEHGVSESLRFHQYSTAYALRRLYDENHSQTRLLLLAEAIFRQTASAEAVGEWGLKLQPWKTMGDKDNTALKYFVPEAKDNKDFVPHKPEPAPYGDDVKLDRSLLPNLKKRKRIIIKKKTPTPAPELQNEVQTQEPEDQEAEAQPEPVATPPRKKQKTSTHESSTTRKSSAPSSGMNGKANASPLRRKTRAGSNVSDSSLSSLQSVPPPTPSPLSSRQEEDEEDVHMQDDGLAGPASGAGIVEVERPSSADVQNGPEPAASSRPIAAGRRRAPARRGRNANVSPDPATNNTNQQNSLNNVANPPAPAQAPRQKSKRGVPDFTPTFKLDDDDDTVKLRRATRLNTLRLTDEHRHEVDSFARGEVYPQELERPQSSHSELSSVPEVEEEPSPPVQKRGGAGSSSSSSGARATRSQKRQHDEVEEDAVSPSPEFPREPEASTDVPSRAGTPSRPAKRQRTGPRLKVSPMKNKAGPSAGVPRARSDRASSIVNGFPNNQEENDDFCSSCGGNGELVCCDGCTRAFHPTCHDPPVDTVELEQENLEWFCHDCQVKRFPSRLPQQHEGPFGPLMNSLEKKFATSFRLPKKVREYFEGVRTGTDGEYEDFVPPTKAKKQKTAQNEEFDWHQLSKDGKPILCHSCHKATQSPGRPIVPCSLCGLWWHIDCLDPPLTHPPNPQKWICPCHTHDLLVQIPLQLAPAHRFRKVKGASDIKFGFRRGNINNGFIEIDDEPEIEQNLSGWRDPQSFGRSFKVSAKGVQGDFLSKVTGPRRFRKTQPPTTEIGQSSKIRSREAARQAFASRQARHPLPQVTYEETDQEQLEAASIMMKFAKKAREDRGERPIGSLPTSRVAKNTDDNRKLISSNRIKTASRDSLLFMEKRLKTLQKRVQDEINQREAEITSAPPARVSDNTFYAFLERKRAKESNNMADSPVDPVDAGNRKNSRKLRGTEKSVARGTSEPPVEIEQESPMEANQRAEVLGGKHESPIVMDNGSESDFDGIDLDIEDEAEAQQDEVAAAGSSADHSALKGTEAPARIVSVPNVESASSAAADKEASEVEPTADSITKLAAMIKKEVEQEPAAHPAVESALTPVSEAPSKDNDDLSPTVPSMKSAANGIETPETETNMADKSASPAEAMDLD